MHPPLSIVALTPAQAQALSDLPELFECVRRLVPGGERPISAVAAARLVRRRTQTVLEAVKAGALPGRFVSGTHGGRGHFEILPSDAVAWARRVA